MRKEGRGTRVEAGGLYRGISAAGGGGGVGTKSSEAEG